MPHSGSESEENNDKQTGTPRTAATDTDKATTEPETARSEPKKVKRKIRSKSAKVKATTSSDSADKKKTKKVQRPQWNRYAYHLNDKSRDKLMEIPPTPQSVKDTNRVLLKKRAAEKRQEEKNEVAKEMLKSIMKSPDSRSTSQTRSRAKTASSLSHNTLTSATTDDEYKKIRFRPIRGDRVQDLNDFDARYDRMNADMDQMRISTTYKNLVRNFRVSIHQYNRSRSLHQAFLSEYNDILDPPKVRMHVTNKSCRRNNYLNHFYDGDTMTGNHR
jgi:hypothetical protein